MDRGVLRFFKEGFNSSGHIVEFAKVGLVFFKNIADWWYAGNMRYC